MGCIVCVWGETVLKRKIEPNFKDQNLGRIPHPSPWQPHVSHNYIFNIVKSIIYNDKIIK